MLSTLQRTDYSFLGAGLVHHVRCVGQYTVQLSLLQRYWQAIRFTYALPEHRSVAGMSVMGSGNEVTN